jgi:O-acetyl-ADP-ribose deacetylase (regulator of RNase III)
MEKPAMRIDVKNVEKAVRAAFDLARKLNLRSIAVPGMGTGIGGVAERDAAQVMVKIAREYLDHFDEIIFVDINEKMVNAWKEFL